MYICACACVYIPSQLFLQTILFTTDDTILELISQNDESFCSMLNEGQQCVENYHVERPVTADNGVSKCYSFIGKCPWVNFNIFNLISFIPFSCIYAETLLLHT
jgi:hypothetical protein